jgi:hypothetical protein
MPRAEDRLRILAFALLALAACHSSSGSSKPGAPQPGAPEARAAVEGFLTAVKAQDLQAMSNIWGSEKGPAREIIGDRAELEKREIVMQCYLTHDRFRILGDVPGTVDDQRVFRVELVKGPLTRSTTFTTVRGPSERWYVLTADLEPVRDLCSKRQG